MSDRRGQAGRETQDNQRDLLTARLNRPERFQREWGTEARLIDYLPANIRPSQMTQQEVNEMEALAELVKRDEAHRRIRKALETRTGSRNKGQVTLADLQHAVARAPAPREQAYYAGAASTPSAPAENRTALDVDEATIGTHRLARHDALRRRVVNSDPEHESPEIGHRDSVRRMGRGKASRAGRNDGIEEDGSGPKRLDRSLGDSFNRVIDQKDKGQHDDVDSSQGKPCKSSMM